MLRPVSAVRFDGRIKVGRTAPCRLTCAHSNGAKVEVVAKFSAGCDRNIGSLVIESIAAMVAADLDLPVPEPFLVMLDEEFIESVADQTAATLMRKSSPVAFGSRHLPPGYTTWPTGKSIPRDAIPVAAEIFAFDALVVNDDRRVENPNCQFRGTSIAIFDHEMAFFTEGIIGWRPPWEPGSLDGLRARNRHLFADQLIGRPVNFNRLEGAWLAISDSRLQEYFDALPDEWSAAEPVADRALMHVGLVRDNIGAALREVRRVLA